MPEPLDPVARAADVVGEAAQRFRDLIVGLDGTTPVVNSDWTVRDVAAHLASGADAYAEVAAGRGSPIEDFDRRGETTGELLASFGEHDLARIADQLDDALPRVVDPLRRLPAGTQLPWHGGITLAAEAVLGAVAGEFLIHGLDVARTVGRPWPIAAHEAAVVLAFFHDVAPHAVDRAAAAGLDAAFDVRIRGEGRYSYRFDDGRLTVTTGGGRADLHVSAAPVPFLLVGYGRLGLARAVLGGGVAAWGRRPFLALVFPKLFQAP